MNLRIAVARAPLRHVESGGNGAEPVEWGRRSRPFPGRTLARCTSVEDSILADVRLAPGATAPAREPQGDPQCTDALCPVWPGARDMRCRMPSRCLTPNLQRRSPARRGNGSRYSVTSDPAAGILRDIQAASVSDYAGTDNVRGADEWSIRSRLRTSLTSFATSARFSTAGTPPARASSGDRPSSPSGAHRSRQRHPAA